MTSTTLTDSAHDVSKFDVSWSKPSLANTTSGHCKYGNYAEEGAPSYADAMPLGNGDVVAMCWANASAGGIGMYVRKADAMDNVTKLLTLGLLQLELSPNPFAAGPYFNQTLSLKTATVVVLAGGSSFTTHRVRLEARVDANQNVVYISVHAADAQQYSLRLTLTPARPAATDWAPPDAGAEVLLDPAVLPPAMARGMADSLVTWHRNVEVPPNETFVAQTVLKAGSPEIGAKLLPLVRDWWSTRTSGIAIDGTAGAGRLTRSSASTLTSTTPGRSFGVRVRVLSNQTSSALKWLGQLAAMDGYGDAAAVERAKVEHNQYWSGFWGRSMIDITTSDADALGWPAFNFSYGNVFAAAKCPQHFNNTCPDGLQGMQYFGCHGTPSDQVGAAISQYYALTRFVFAAQSRTMWPIKFNGMLYNANHINQWTGAPDHREWGNDNWWQNLRLPYWSMYAAGDFEQLDSLFEYYLNMLPFMAERTKLFYNHSGTS